jgi:hypothetical protein
MQETQTHLSVVKTELKNKNSRLCCQAWEPLLLFLEGVLKVCDICLSKLKTTSKMVNWQPYCSHTTLVTEMYLCDGCDAITKKFRWDSQVMGGPSLSFNLYFADCLVQDKKWYIDLQAFTWEQLLLKIREFLKKDPKDVGVRARS